MPIPNFKNIKELKKYLITLKREKKALPTKAEIAQAKDKVKPKK